MNSRRTWLIAGVAAAGILAVAALGWSYANRPDAAASPAPSVTEASGSRSASPTPSPSSTAQAFRPGDIIATASADLEVFPEPGASEPAQTLSQWSYYGSPLTLLATGTDTVEGDEWLHVLLPQKPNGSDGWIRASDVEITSTDFEVRIYLDEHELDLVRDGEVELTIPVAVGAAETPTPLGLFYVTDPLDFTANDTGRYGAYALGLSGFSEVLESFDGGPPQIAMHGTNQPELIGQNVSNGCIRMSNDDVLRLVESVGLGTPVAISQSR